MNGSLERPQQCLQAVAGWTFSVNGGYVVWSFVPFSRKEGAVVARIVNMYTVFHSGVLECLLHAGLGLLYAGKSKPYGSRLRPAHHSEQCPGGMGLRCPT